VVRAFGLRRSARLFLGAVLLGASLAGAGRALAAQSPKEAPPPVGPRFRVLLDFSGPSEELSQGYADSLASALVQSASVLSVSRAPPSEAPMSVRAEREACSAALRVSLELGASSARLGWEVYVPPREEAVDRGEVEKDIPDARSLASSFWIEPLSALEAAVAGASIPSSYVKLVGAPGTRVRGLGAEIVLPDSGEVDIPLVLPAYIVWSAEAEGARKEGGAMLAEESGARIEIPRRAPPGEPRWSIDASALGFSFPELSVRYELGRRTFLRATLTQYFFGLSLQDTQNSSASTEDTSIFASYRLLQPGLGFGYLFSNPSSHFRFYSTFDLFLRIAFIEGESAMLEPVAPWGSCLALGSDWGRSQALRLFFELGLVAYPWADRVLMLASWSGKGMGRATMGGNGFIKGQPGWFAEFPQPRIGLRIRL